MDAYVREFGATLNHDEFYTNETIIDIFKSYTTNIVSRYVNSPAVFGWELANDPRSVICHSIILQGAGRVVFVDVTLRCPQPIAILKLSRNGIQL